MRKVLPLLFFFLLSIRVSAAPPVPVVCRVDANLNGNVYSYTQPQKMSAILTGLRLLKYEGTAQQDPEIYTGSACRITVFLSNGCRHCYYLRSGGFLSKDHKPWILVDQTQSETFFAIFKKLSPDTLKGSPAGEPLVQCVFTDPRGVRKKRNIELQRLVGSLTD